MHKVHVNVGTIGHIDHGKTTLTAAILAVQAERGLAERKDYHAIARGGVRRDETKTVTVIASHVRYETDDREYAHVDCPGQSTWAYSRVSVSYRTWLATTGTVFVSSRRTPPRAMAW